MIRSSRVWATTIKPEAFRLQAGEDNLGDYQFNSHSVHHYFCKTCGLKPFGRGDIPEVGGKFVSINLACLDDLEPAELVAAPIQYSDGLNNRWERAPAETRHL